jgi:gluconate 2-dehydrogenase gamma chain
MASGDVVRTGGQHSRRDFLKGAGLVAGGLALGGVAGYAANEAISEDGSSEETTSTDGGAAAQTVPPLDESEIPLSGLTFFSIAQARTIQAMTARIFPSDEESPGALEAGVVYYIDQQLGGSWGMGYQWYMQGPFAPGEATQGWQYHLAPADAYQTAIRSIDEHCQEQYQLVFIELSPELQDEVITALAAGEITTFKGIAGHDFFGLLRENTLEGMYCDPMYRGNHNMVGWRLKRYPGSYVTYRDSITSQEFIELAPQPLAEGHLGTLNPEDSGTSGIVDHPVGHHNNLHPLDPQSYQAHN